MRISTAQIFQQGLDSILKQQLELSRTQLQLSTGKKINSPSDDPSGAARLLDLRQTASVTEQYQENILAAQGRLELEDSVLRSVTTSLQRARELAVRGLNGSQTAEDRTAIAREIRQINAEVLSLANTKDGNGDYLFAGTRSTTVPFTTNGSGVFTYSGDQGQRFLQVGPTRQIADGDTGFDVFMKIPAASGPGYEDVFSTLDRLAVDLEANTPSGGSLDQLDNALDNLLTIQALSGARLNAIDREKEVNESLLLEVEKARSSVEDVDIVEAALRLSQQSTVLEAAQQSYARVQNLSLFNFL